MLVRKLLFHLRTILTVFWYRVLYGSRLHLGKHLSVRKDFNLMIASYGTVSIGRNCFFNSHCTIDVEVSVSIGDDCLFAENVKIYDNNHRFSKEETPIREQGSNSAPIVIGRNCWLASNVVVLKGSTIGDNCVIGANCIIDGEIPPGSIVRVTTPQKICPIDYH